MANASHARRGLSDARQRSGRRLAAVATTVGVMLALAMSACVPLFLSGLRSERAAIMAHARVWQPTDVASMDLRAGPSGADAFAPGATVECDYTDAEMGGRSPKFRCEIGDDDFKVKFGRTNGEVYGEVLASRLLWSLGFLADRMYPVTVVCRGCPPALGGLPLGGGVRRFEPAAIERKAAGAEWPPNGPQGWSWTEFATVAPAPDGAPRAQRDALELMAAFLQHSDSKPENQEIRCLGEGDVETLNDCDDPWLLINDLGLTFGRASWTNANDVSGVNLAGWREVPVWKQEVGCVANMSGSFSGTLTDPPISEDGRAFLAGLLVQLSDRQLHDLFEVARVDLRLRAPRDAGSGHATVHEWVEVFKDKRRQIVERRCA